MLMLMMSVCQCNAKEEQDMRIICIAASIADIMLSAAFKQNQQSFSRSSCTKLQAQCLVNAHHE